MDLLLHSWQLAGGCLHYKPVRTHCNCWWDGDGPCCGCHFAKGEKEEE